MWVCLFCYKFVDVSKRGKHLALKIILWSILGLVVAVAVAVQVVLSPKVLTRLANKYAAEYVDGEVRFSNIKASVFKSFPNLNVTADGFSVVGQDPPDTLASFDRLSLSINYMEALKGKVKVKHAILEHPRIFLHQDTFQRRHIFLHAASHICREGEPGEISLY